MTENTTIPVPKGTTIKIGEDLVDRFLVNPIGFLGYVELAMEALDRDTKKVEVTLQRLRVLRQCVPMTKTGTVIPWAESDVVTLPIPVARQILDAIRATEGTGGEVLKAGNGIDTPILFKLGAVVMTKKNGEDMPIAELEFQASTFGAIEDVLAEFQKMKQAALLIENIAKPVAVSGLVRIPTWVAESISIADGFVIMNKVLPAFFE